LLNKQKIKEHNLNRQNFSNIENLGKEKVMVVKEGIKKINPALHVNAFVQKFNPKSDFDMIKDCDVVVDALDNPQTKLELAQICKENSMNFVHGAIAGMNGQFSTCNTLENLYRDGSSGIEKSIGNPSFSVTFAASIQSAEVIKTLLKMGENLENKILITNLLENEFIIKKDKTLYLRYNSRKTFYELINPYIIPSMMYKLNGILLSLNFVNLGNSGSRQPLSNLHRNM